MRVALLLTLSACCAAGCAADVSQSIASPESSVASLQRGDDSSSRKHCADKTALRPSERGACSAIYSLSTKKLAEHGGFADDDAHVACWCRTLCSARGCPRCRSERPT
jgi:hypothetical protein